MAVQFNIPASPKRSILTIDEFLGADFTNSPASADINKSPNCVNMIRDVPGKVRKCMGYETVDEIFDVNEGLGMSSYIFFENGMEEYGIETDYTDIYVGTHEISITATDEDDNDLDVEMFDSQEQMAIWYDYFGNKDIRRYIIASNPLDDTIKSVRIIQSGSSYVLNIRTAKGEYPRSAWKMFTNPETYELCQRLPINGFHKLRTDNVGVVHAGSKLIRDNTILYDDANNARSKSWEFDDHLYILDGKQFLKCGYTEPESDTKYKNDKLNNDVVKDDEVTLIIKRYPKKANSLKITSKSTTSTNGKFAVSKDKRTITYTDKLTAVHQTVTYSCTWKYKKTSSSTEQTVSISPHTLTCISGEKYFSADSVSDDAYVPLLTISRDPNGGGTPHEDLNLLSPWFEEDFLGQASVKDYQMSFDDLDEVEPIVEVMDSHGEFQELVYGSEYTCDYETGVITFVVAPGVSPVSGTDNVKIKACKTFEKYKDRINKCTIGALYGVNGTLNSIFFSGNPDYINYDWHSEENNPSYVKDTSYSVLGSSSSAIIGYSVVSNYLATHKDRYERDQNIILREGDLVDNQPAFRIINTLQGAGAIAPFSFAYLATEPIFLTEQGVYAVTAQDITGEKYAQDRSFFLNGRLLQEENLKDAYALTYNDMYLLCINDSVYILDGLQPIRTDRAEPYATRQYAGFYRTNVPARVMWEDNGRLFFGTEDGKVCRFFNDKYSNESYNDDGEVIEAIWETPDIVGKVFFKNKTLRHIAVKLDSSISTSVNIYVMNRGLYNFVKTDGRLRELWDLVAVDNTRARFLSFSNLIFSRFTFSNDQTQHTLPTKVRVKKVDKFRLKLTNDQLNEPFGLFDIGFEYVENGNYKG